MDDSCAVCAEALEWVAYGSCGHREVCSTCVARLRFICNDRRCCICKSESDIIFVTKALGDYTRMINDFSVFPSDSREGKVGPFWYHEDTQAYFDDSDHYRMIKAMCRLSCSVCENMEEQGNDGPKRRPKFKNIDQLKSHLYHRHRLLMCSLCLEGRKIFICEQKLYTRAQLNQHINTGDSVVDGNESERGGFMGHPMCEFCRDPFYGDNELYTHMSTEHYTCHICQRQNPGQYEYYKDYNDLEIHFRQEHFLCEDEACLAKKFIVFPSEPELKRHNATEHGGRMSRSQRNAALQIPISFRYRRSNDQDRRRGRGRALNPDSSDNQLSLAILASFETINADGTTPESSGREVVSEQQETNEIDPILGPFESLATMDSDTSSRYLHAVRQKSSNSRLEESSFPPLSLAPGSSQLKSKNDLEKMATNNMAARLRRHNNGNVNVLNKARALPAANRGRALSSSSQPAAGDGSGSSSYSSSTQIKQVTVNEAGSTDSSSSSWNFVSSRRLGHSSSAPNLVDRESIDSSTSNFPPVSVRQKHKLSTDAATQKLTTSNQYVLNVEDVHAANSSLVERIRATLEFDEDKYSAFKGISAEYRQGLIGTEEYLLYVQQFGLSHLVLELARLCPDAQKQKELIEIYNANFRGKGLQENGFENSSAHSKKINPSQKGKGKCVDNGVSSPKDKLADSIISTVRKLQSSYKPSDEELEVLPKDGYRAAAARGKTKLLVDEKQAEVSYAPHHVTDSGRQNDSQSTDSGSNLNPGPRGGEGKQRKKTSKFHRVRLGDGSAAALLDLRQPDPGPDPVEETTDGNQNIPSGLPLRSVWRNGGGQRLMSMSQRDPKSFR